MACDIAPFTVDAGTIFARWGNGDNSAVGVVGRANGGSCECGIGENARLNTLC